MELLSFKRKNTRIIGHRSVVLLLDLGLEDGMFFLQCFDVCFQTHGYAPSLPVGWRNGSDPHVRGRRTGPLCGAVGLESHVRAAPGALLARRLVPLGQSGHSQGIAPVQKSLQTVCPVRPQAGRSYGLAWCCATHCVSYTVASQTTESRLPVCPTPRRSLCLRILHPLPDRPGFVPEISPPAP